MLNFVYCLDKNYNIQALTSINSLLERIDEKVNIHIIHDDPDSLNLNHLKNTAKASITKHYLNLDSHKFPNLKGAHVSKATYFRLFISELLPDNLDFIIYIDADIVCLNNPIKELKQSISQIKNSKHKLAAKTEHYKSEVPEEKKNSFNILNLSGNKYFNAGVLIVDYQYWLKEGVENKLLKILEEYYEKIKFWDQDILNKFFDGKYIELTNMLNFDFGIYDKDKFNEHFIYENVFFTHFNGKGKPWSLQNILFDSSEIYQKEYRKLEIKYYHITYNYELRHLKKYISNLLNFNFLKLEKPFIYLKLSFKTIFNIKA